MNLDNENLKWKLCEAYFSILEKSMTSEVSLDELCKVSKISLEEATRIVSDNSINNGNFFLKILISKIDKEVLSELKEDITDDTVSSTYDKLLEGLSLRFEKYFEYKQSLKKLSKNSKQKLQVFMNVFKENYTFFSNLLTLVEEEQNCGLKILKSMALNIVFTKSLEIFLKDENKDIDSVIRYLDKYLSDLEDIGLLVGVIKNKS
jgi:ACT domain-containing protein